MNAKALPQCLAGPAGAEPTLQPTVGTSIRTVSTDPGIGRRYAIYWAPPAAHPLWRAGSHWLGRDAESGDTWAADAGRAEPRRYGFHATLKPPFTLREGIGEPGLLAALADFASTQVAFDMPALGVATLGRFIALRPVDSTAAHDARSPLRLLADACVRDLDALRRPPTPEESARRFASGLDAEQVDHLRRWGYPHVFGSWRFHMTLTDPLTGSMTDDPASPDLRDAWLRDACRHFADALVAPLRCDAIALFVEPAPRADFRLQARFGFGR